MDIVFRCLSPFAMFLNQSLRCRIVGIVTGASTWPKNVVYIQMGMTIIFFLVAAVGCRIAAAAAVVFICKYLTSTWGEDE